MNRLIWIPTAGLCLLLHAGCSSMQTIPARMKAVVSRTPDGSDPLAVGSAEISGSFKSAKKELKKADQTLLKFARWREDMGDFVEARQQYKDILADNPGNVDARIGVARVEFATGRVAAATDILMATARIHPDRADVWVELGRMQSERQQWGLAVQSLQKAIEIEPDDEVAGYQLGVALARTDRVEEARPYLAAAVGESAALYNIGYVLHEADRDQEAAHWFRQALNSHPDQRTRALSARMLTKLSDDSAADGDRSNVAQLQPQSKIDVELTSYKAWREIPGQQRPAADSGPAVTPQRQATSRPTQFANQPAQYSNQPAQYSNQPAQYSNQPAQYSNQPAQFSNQPSRSPNPPTQSANPPTQFSNQSVASHPGNTNIVQVPQWQGPAASGMSVNVPSATAPPQAPVEPQPWRGGGQ